MTQEEKDLLLKDICTRLPYKVKVEAKGLLKTIADEYDARDTINAHVLNGLNLKDYFKTYSIESMVNIPLFNRKGVCNIKPYLFPLSSMTEEERIAIGNEFAYGQPHKAMDILHQRHIDYRGLIEKGLALDATGKNIY